MQTCAIRTQRVTPGECNVLSFIEQTVSSFQERSILAISAKVVSICQGRVIPVEAADKESLIRQEADRWLPFDSNPYRIPLTWTRDRLIPMAGIDESNGDGVYILWPQEPQAVANQVREHLCQRFGIEYAGVMLTDSGVIPLRMGTVGIGLAHSGFLSICDYRGQSDLFGNTMKVTAANLLDGLAASAVTVMGEGNEQTPLVTISDLPFVTFQDRNPTREELLAQRISPDVDLFGPLLHTDLWCDSQDSASRS